MPANVVRVERLSLRAPEFKYLEMHRFSGNAYLVELMINNGAMCWLPNKSAFTFWTVEGNPEEDALHVRLGGVLKSGVWDWVGFFESSDLFKGFLTRRGSGKRVPLVVEGLA